MMAPATPASGPWVFVDDVEAPSLSGDDRHHLERVLRVRVGDPVVVSDGAGRWRPGALGSAGVVEPAGEVEHEAPPQPPITVAFALTKGERPELAVQKLTELGVDEIVPFTAARSVVRWDDQRAAANAERLRRVAREASMQSRRAWLPAVADVSSFATAVALPGAVLADRGGRPPSLSRPTVLVGPEGGWTDEERACGLASVGLGEQVLRAETAAIAAGALLAALRARLVRPRA
ncbi:MAG TPA: RsmE family RNA methyltransferase [Acidimicrobiales bacterium]|nr:RsmE family RNA methyltransferase [Acidimicrobiales bacterium]